jgi:carbohydrate-binding DOMON domain-containing protein
MLKRVFAMSALFAVVTLLAISTTVVVNLVDVVSDIRSVSTVGRTIVFEMDDPSGDDYGPGTYTYPTNKLFEPFKGLFDLERFSVSYDAASVFFDLTFREVLNPLGAPEGFGHILVDIYVSTATDVGSTVTFREGANVQFGKSYPWQYFVRVGPWHMTSMYRHTDELNSLGIREGISAILLPDAKTVRVTVKRDLLGIPTQDWKYYVLVGSQDGYGPDEYRLVKQSATQWDFGGGQSLDWSPRVIDMLAPADGKYTQEKMLNSFDITAQSLATVYPVPLEGDRYLVVALVLGAFVLITFIGLILFRTFRRRRTS